MRPITKAEVEAALNVKSGCPEIRPTAEKLILFEDGATKPWQQIWIFKLAYEIARARHQPIETKWENAKAHFERHAKRMGASWALDIMKQEDEAEEFARARAEKGEEL
jgi:hypothetical protein